MLHLNKGFLPVPKNQTTIISGHGTQNNLQLNDNSQKITYAIGEISGIERTQVRIADRFNERHGMGSSNIDKLPEQTLEAHEVRETGDVIEQDASEEPDEQDEPPDELPAEPSEPLSDWNS